ncbi:N-acetyltransferase family protein [Kineococcus sp. TBRC 1896]|uniref:N-acetyltransferase family protein n=1 Tax=Kineococcus mangrovi TaxID=1660183 RepID=A0ABV4I8G0_9ACTN
MEILRVPDPVPTDVLAGLVEVLRDAVRDGASVGFVRVPAVPDAEQWWRRYLPGGWTWVATEDVRGSVRVVGTVSLRVDQPENAPHRAELTKLLVHRDSRGRGVASRLVAAAEGAAAVAGRTLLVLDTETGSPAEGVYERWGWHRVGTIEGYAVNPAGHVAGTTVFSKVLRASSAAAGG